MRRADRVTGVDRGFNHIACWVLGPSHVVLVSNQDKRMLSVKTPCRLTPTLQYFSKSSTYQLCAFDHIDLVEALFPQ